MNTCEISGQVYPILAGVWSKTAGEYVPLVDLPVISDFQWQVKALAHRLTHRESYEGREDVDGVIAYLRKWLVDHGKVN